MSARAHVYTRCLEQSISQQGTLLRTFHCLLQSALSDPAIVWNYAFSALVCNFSLRSASRGCSLFDSHSARDKITARISTFLQYLRSHSSVKFAKISPPKTMSQAPKSKPTSQCSTANLPNALILICNHSEINRSCQINEHIQF